MKFQIVSDGSCDLEPQIAEENNIRVVPFYVTFDGITYDKEIEEIGVKEFYQKMVDNPKKFPKSSLPSVSDFEEVFRPYAQEEIPVICICITTKFSGSYNSALAAKEIVTEEFPKAQITVIDSKINTVLQGIYVLEAAKMQKAGKTYEEIIAYLENAKETGRILFTIGSIDYLKNGGRIGKLMGIAGSTLGIKPLIELKEGEIFPFGITRSREKSKRKVIDRVWEHFETSKENPENYVFAVGYGYDYDEAVAFRTELLKSLRQHMKIDDIPLFQIGATIGVHTGPYPIGVGLLKRAMQNNS